MLDYIVLYQSETGNTKKLATEIFASLPGMAKDLISIDEGKHIPEAKTYFVGFCVHHGTCTLEIGNLLSDLSAKNVALFGTCGISNCADYYKSIENSVSIWLEDDNAYLGAFICQGKMPLKIRQKFEKMMTKQGCDADKIKKQLQNFDEAMIHPTEEDVKNVREFAAECLKALVEI
ncbi:MAG: flavodoxin family protein BilS [Lachnospiraceae bacterium]